jgi:predicted dienelactone hydrolase
MIDRPSSNTGGAVPPVVLSIGPVVLAAPGRAVDLHLRITAPRTGRDLPLILLSHGQGGSNNLSSLNGYGPLVQAWAAQGFVVLQPTHLSSNTLRGDSRVAAAPGAPLFWKSRVEDMRTILDQLAVLEETVPEIAGRLDPRRIAVVGHSMGGHTAGLLLGAQLTEEDGTRVSLAEPRITAGALLAPPGQGGANIHPAVAARMPAFRHPSFAEMTTPTLVVVGDADVSPHFTTRGADWHADPYCLSPSPKALLTLFGGGHLLGGVSGYDAAETTDENPARVALVSQLTGAYLRSVLYPGDASWQLASQALAETPSPLGQVESK